MTKGGSTYFQKLNKKEKDSKAALAAKLQASLTVWEKGSKNRESFSLNEFKPQSGLFICSSLSKKSSLIGKNVLFSFEINNLSFFGSGELKELNSGFFALQTAEELYKSERRNTFRLLTYPHQKVFLRLELEMEEAEGSNVVGFKTGMSQTGLFKNFLGLIDGNDDEASAAAGLVEFRVLDLSVTGAAIMVGDLEAEIFSGGSKTGDIILDFNGKKIDIPGGEVVYNVAMVPARSGQKIRKVGIKFLEVDTNLDQKIGKLINNALRDFESEFEDFVK